VEALTCFDLSLFPRRGAHEIASTILFALQPLGSCTIVVVSHASSSLTDGTQLRGLGACAVEVSYVEKA